MRKINFDIVLGFGALSSAALSCNREFHGWIFNARWLNRHTTGVSNLLKNRQ